MTAFNRQLAAAAAQYESAAEDDAQRVRRPTGPDDGDIYADGWLIGKKPQPVISVAEGNRRYREYLAGVSK